MKMSLQYTALLKVGQPMNSHSSNFNPSSIWKNYLHKANLLGTDVRTSFVRALQFTQESEGGFTL